MDPVTAPLDESSAINIGIQLVGIAAGIFVRKSVSTDDLTALNSIQARLDTLKQHEQDIASGKITG
jgi:hypothetical protein